jgi:hypothetical protein
MIRFFISNGRTQSAPMGGRWGMILGVAMAATLGLVLVTVSIGLLLVLAPVVIIGGLIARARLRRLLREMGIGQPREGDAPRSPFQRSPGDGDVIEGEYRVVEEEKPRRPAP